MDKIKQLSILKNFIYIFKFICTISISVYLIPIIMIFETNLYDMEFIAILFVIASSIVCTYYSTINYVTNCFIKDTEKKSIDKFNSFQNIANISTLDIVNIIFIILMLISYTICLIVFDGHIMTKVLYFAILIPSAIGMYRCMHKYIVSIHNLNKIIQKYYYELWVK